MPTAAVFINTAVVFWLLSCLAIGLGGARLKHVYPSAALLVGALLMLAGAIAGWYSPISWNAPPPIFLALVPFSCRLDALAAIYIGTLAVITIAISFFSPGYLRHLDDKINSGCYWVQLFLFVLGMLGVLLAANALTFLVCWEMMALASALLVATNLSNVEARKAAFIYLGTTRIATTFLMAGFLWMYSISQTWELAQWHFSEAFSFLPALLILIGLCIKSGVWPFHGWLPFAHPAAPAPVSALMSGVMIQVSLYAIIRILVMNGLDSPLLSYAMVALGLISAICGVVSALVQHDLKTLLAYSSIENVGLILSGIGLALVENHLDMPVIAAISLSAAIFQCINHGVFKALLFLSVGAVDSSMHTRDLELLGGLGKQMPWTMLFFVVGSMAICALPPLNGFNSKWLFYQSFFQLAFTSGSLWIGGMSITCIAVLAIVSGMALFCFTKATGISFLGRSRSRETHKAREVSPPMLAGQMFLALLCLLLGSTTPQVLSIIEPACTESLKSPVPLADIYTVPMAFYALMLLLVTLLLYMFLKFSGKIRRYQTWECGFGDLTERMQATALSFSESVAYTFAPLFQYHKHSVIAGKDRRHFPERVSIETHMTWVVEAYVYLPVVKSVRWFGEQMLRLQAGSVHLYLGYMLVTLVLLLVIGVLR